MTQGATEAVLHVLQLVPDVLRQATLQSRVALIAPVGQRRSRIRVELLLELLLGLDHLSHSVVHVVHEFDLRETEPSLVADIEDSVVAFAVLSVNSSDLHVVLLRDLLEALVVLAQQRQLDVNARSETRSEVRRARRDVAEVVAVAELRLLLDLLLGASESLEHLLDVSSLLHRDDSELVCSNKSNR